MFEEARLIAQKFVERWNWSGPRPGFHDETGTPMVRLDDAADVASALLSMIPTTKMHPGDIGLFENINVLTPDAWLYVHRDVPARIQAEKPHLYR